MRRAESEDAFFASPVGTYLVSHNLAYWCLDESLWGVTIVGHADDATTRRLIAWMDREHEHSYPPYCALLDFRRVKGMSPVAFAEFGAFTYRNRARQAERVLRGAVVRPEDGMFAAAMQGAISLFRLIVRWDAFGTLEGALAALGAADRAPEIDALLEELSRSASVVELLHELWARAPEQTSIDRAARALGLSVRSLQRRLREGGTTFETELRRARVRRAQRMLAETDLKLAAIAHEAGFASHAHFTQVFGEEVGMPPGAWRDRAARLPDDGAAAPERERSS